MRLGAIERVSIEPYLWCPGISNLSGALHGSVSLLGFICSDSMNLRVCVKTFSAVPFDNSTPCIHRFEAADGLSSRGAAVGRVTEGQDRINDKRQEGQAEPETHALPESFGETQGDDDAHDEVHQGDWAWESPRSVLQPEEPGAVAHWHAHDPLVPFQNCRFGHGRPRRRGKSIRGFERPALHLLGPGELELPAN